MPYSVHKQFAENLFRLTHSVGSIAEVCRQTGINRQQFNKYLAGVNLPNEKIMATLAKFFGVTEHQLVEPDEVACKACPAPPLMSGIKSASAACMLADGLYSGFALWPADQTKVMHVVLRIRREGAFTYFSRIGRYPREKGGLSLGRLIRMEGVVLQSGTQIVFFGREEKHWTEFFSSLFLSAVNRSTSEIWPGMLTIMMPAGVPMALRVVVMKEHRDLTLRHILRMRSVETIDDSTLPEEVRRFLKNTPSSLPCVDALDEIRQTMGKISV